ncbi:transketolase [Thalassotalea ponticola]|uniref:transketolase n=1 Tax=Thalassotalea ponticola TaxID=1523392 RepID=UPI0025B43A45|nr:transketolase [Thalassotalea ponticola]MDN3653554.1 transketolase [Thalassotalea ponticola]
MATNKASRQQLANAIRVLAMDAVQKANSGHPGAPMGMADIAEVVFNDHLQHNPSNPHWVDRDRFVLSNGHGSMLIYALLHLTGYDLSMDDLKQFRQLHSRTPGHPEYGYTAGVETTTGPLGAGIANAVGMAIGEKVLAAHFNRDGFDIVDHHTYCFLGDGCLMEGISHEVCSLAGTLGLGKLIAFYDDNGISIDGHVEGWFTDDTAMRFKAYGWQVIESVDGHNSEAINQAIVEAKTITDKPTLIICKTVIGFGSPNKSGSHDCHGSPLGDDEIAASRKFLNWSEPPFVISDDIYQGWDAKQRGAQLESTWHQLFSDYQTAHPKLASEFKRRVMERTLPENFDQLADQFIGQCQQQMDNIASRKASQNAIEAFAAQLPELLGGSADLAGSNLTLWSGSKGVTKDDANGNYLYYGVREFGMTAIMNGLSLHGGFINYGATFLMFMEYARNAVRMSALMGIQNIFVYTHDSIGQGEDGPTHQPVEQLTNLRTTPKLITWRPCDATESAVAWKMAIKHRQGPSALVFSRQNLTHQQRSEAQVKAIERGGYILRDCDIAPQVVLLATGSEVDIAMQAANELSQQGHQIRVVSMPSTNVFDQQSTEYQQSVLPNTCPIVAIEAAHPDFWHKYVGKQGRIIGLDSFGESAPGGTLMRHFGFSSDNIVATIKSMI